MTLHGLSNGLGGFDAGFELKKYVDARNGSQDTLFRKGGILVGLLNPNLLCSRSRNLMLPTWACR